jgi:hypothetical protein
MTQPRDLITHSSFLDPIYSRSTRLAYAVRLACSSLHGQGNDRIHILHQTLFRAQYVHNLCLETTRIWTTYRNVAEKQSGGRCTSTTF